MSIYETQLNILSKTVKLISDTLKNTEKELSIEYLNALEVLRESPTDYSEDPEIKLDRINCIQKSIKELKEINEKYDKVFFDLINQIRQLEEKIHQYHNSIIYIFKQKKDFILDK